MNYKVGDEVLVKAEVIDVHKGTDKPYFVMPNFDSVDWVSEDKIIPMVKTYEMGLSDAWELAKKIAGFIGDGGYSMEELRNIFGDSQTAVIFRNHTYEEALAKIKAYEKEKEIKVGDIVTINSVKGMAVVTNVGEGSVNVMWDDGIAGNCETNRLKKTGKHIDIESLLRQLGE